MLNKQKDQALKNEAIKWLKTFVTLWSSKLKTLTVAEEHGNKLAETEFGIDTVNKSSLF